MLYKELRKIAGRRVKEGKPGAMVTSAADTIRLLNALDIAIKALAQYVALETAAQNRDMLA